MFEAVGTTTYIFQNIRIKSRFELLEVVKIIENPMFWRLFVGVEAILEEMKLKWRRMVFSKLFKTAPTAQKHGRRFLP